jgi:hypothetical protein
MELIEQIKAVAESRKRIDDYYRQKRESYAKWEADNFDLLADLKMEEGILSQFENSVRELTIEAFKQTGNKQPCDGVGIREVTKYNYDPKNALTWAKEHNLALKLDDAAFKKIIKADTPEFVEVIIEPQATIATDLSKYL